MKLKSFIALSCTALLTLSSASAFAAYTIRNETSHNLNVYDTLGALAATVPPGKTVDCKRRCWGPTFLHAIPTNGKLRVLCSWHGIVLKDRVNTVVISQVQGITYPERGYCQMEYRYA